MSAVEQWFNSAFRSMPEAVTVLLDSIEEWQRTGLYP
jgi:hypothetical protein